MTERKERVRRDNNQTGRERKRERRDDMRVRGGEKRTNYELKAAEV